MTVGHDERDERDELPGTVLTDPLPARAGEFFAADRWHAMTHVAQSASGLGDELATAIVHALATLDHAGPVRVAYHGDRFVASPFSFVHV